MSDGALSPEATKAFASASFQANFPINTGEGGLTSNYFVTHKLNHNDNRYLDTIHPEKFKIIIFKFMSLFFNKSLAFRILKYITINKMSDTYIYCYKSHVFFRPNWSSDLKYFPKEVPKDMPDIILQIGSGLYGVKDKDDKFDEDRYKKVMSFCKMTEIKIAQGAKQTGGKIVASKITPEIAYYRDTVIGKDLISPNRFPYANTTQELLEFVGKLQNLSKKPVGIKIVISDRDNTQKFVQEIKDRFDKNMSIPDFITIDGGDGGSATAPLELMESVGLTSDNSLFIIDYMLSKYNLRDKIKVVVSGKILTPDDVIVKLSLGADMISIARGFMMSAGCIRARHCSGVGGKKCPVGLATQDKKKRASYLINKERDKIANYHNNLLQGIKTVLAVVGVDQCSKLQKQHLAYKTNSGDLYFDIKEYFEKKLHLK
jgi:glutamate synthase domain-containing protein 2